MEKTDSNMKKQIIRERKGLGRVSCVPLEYQNEYIRGQIAPVFPNVNFVSILSPALGLRLFSNRELKKALI